MSLKLTFGFFAISAFSAAASSVCQLTRPLLGAQADQHVAAPDFWAAPAA